jgi:hypothetical protein
MSARSGGSCPALDVAAGLGEGVGAGGDPLDDPVDIGQHILGEITDERLLRAVDLAPRPLVHEVLHLEGERPHVDQGLQRVGAVGRGVDRGHPFDLGGEGPPSDRRILGLRADPVGDGFDPAGETPGEIVHTRAQDRGTDALAQGPGLLHDVRLPARGPGCTGRGREAEGESRGEGSSPGVGDPVVVHERLLDAPIIALASRSGLP